MNETKSTVGERIAAMATIYGKHFTDKEINSYLEAVEKYSDELILQCCKEWEAKETKMCFPAQLRTACHQKKEYRDLHKPESKFDLRCEYNDMLEDQISRDLCCEVTKQDKINSQVQFNQTLCKWHYEVAYSRCFPDSNTAALVKHLYDFRVKFCGNTTNDATKNASKPSNSGVSIGSLIEGSLKKINTPESALNR